MKKLSFITNKYFLSFLILLCLFLADILLHRGISRVIIPSSFSNNIRAVNLPLCGGQLLAKDKNWVKSVNSIELMNNLPLNTAGIQCNVYYDERIDHFKVCSDTSALSTLSPDSLFDVYASKKLSADVWFNLNSLAATNVMQTLKEIIRLKNKYSLQKKIIVESTHAAFLKPFCDSGFFTAYRVPFFNPYYSSEKEMILFADSVRKSLSQYPASAVSGYYFQYPALKKFFPNYPILTWIDHTSVSVVSFVFRRQLQHDERIKVILSPLKD